MWIKSVVVFETKTELRFIQAIRVEHYAVMITKNDKFKLVQFQ